MTKKTAHVEVRSMPAKGTFPKRGPDTYVMVQIVPEGVEKLTVLNHNAADRRGITLIPYGKGYSQHRGPKSALGQAIAEAEEFTAEYNGENNPENSQE